MKYTEGELKKLVLPMLQSMPKGGEDQLADAIVQIIIQDRQANETDQTTRA